MKSVVLASSLAVVVGALALFSFDSGGDRGADEGDAVSEELAALRQELAEMRKAQESVERQLASMKESLAAREHRTQSPTGEIAQSEEKPDSAAAAVAEAVQEPTAAEETLEAALETLVDDEGASFLDKQRVWNELSTAGLIDEAIKTFEELVEENPENPDLRTDLGHAYMRKALSQTNHFEQGKWATQADRTFDTALALDSNHWDARFSKAASLGFWPAVYGKQSEAIKHLEILRAQQKELPPQEHFAQTYLFLGNMYQGLNDGAKAREAWQAGAELFPENRELQKRVGTNGDG